MSKLKLISALVFFTLSSGFANAGVIVGGTRLVYFGDKKETSISVKNHDKDKPYLIQSWVDDAGQDDTNKGNKKPPFIVTPPLFRLDADSENSIRVVQMSGTASLPKDKETVYWMDIKSIPSSSKTASETVNSLQIAVKTRIKLFYRPATIKENPIEEAEKITFSKKEAGILVVNNPTPFYYTFYALKLGGQVVNTGDLMLAPKGNTELHVDEIDKSNQVVWNYINDFGGISKEFKSVIK